MAIQTNTPIDSSTSQTGDVAEDRFENTLRPKKLDEFVGQSRLKRNLSVMITAAQKRKETAPHLLFFGPPGLGKTTLAGIVATEMGGSLRITSGPAIEKSGDLAAILTNLQEGDVLFLDEIHRLRRPVEEILYSALEDFALDLVVGKGPGARSMRLQLPKFTLVAATTRLGSLSSPLRDRFGDTLRLEFYKIDELSQIIYANAQKLDIKVDDLAVARIAACSRGTPRISNRILHRMRDFAHVEHLDVITDILAKKALTSLGIDEIGLTESDRRFLTTIASHFRGGPVGLSTLAAATAEEQETISDIREPFLLQQGFLERTPKGRMLTANAYAHLHLNPPSEPNAAPLF
jgi:Holliday junction DNA helicase RuvB